MLDLEYETDITQFLNKTEKLNRNTIVNIKVNNEIVKLPMYLVNKMLHNLLNYLDNPDDSDFEDNCVIGGSDTESEYEDNDDSDSYQEQSTLNSDTDSD